MKFEEWKSKVMAAHVPTFFKVSLLEAAMRTPINTSDGVYRKSYADSGYHLGIHFLHTVSKKALKELDTIDGEDIDALKIWLKKHLGTFIELVPSGRPQMTFSKGFMNYLKDNC